MERRQTNAVYKYFDLTDQFLRIRLVDLDEAAELLQTGGLPNRSAYRHMILEACVVGWSTDVMPALERAYPGDQEAAEDLLYQICVEVNPRLEIHQVALPAQGAELEGESGSAHQLSPEEIGRERWRKRAVDLEARLKECIVGQDVAIHQLVRYVRKHAAGLSNAGRPIGSFLLIGNTGVGKTALAKRVAEVLFDSPDHFVRIDCSEFALAHEYSKLIGAPPGYVGHGEGGILTEALLRVDESVVLFDEVEKAHPKVHQLLLQALDEGRLTDSRGRTVSFENSLILLTSNVGTSELIAASNSMGFDRNGNGLNDGTRVSITQEALRRTFSPEFLNRLSEKIYFRDLDPANCRQIARLEVEKVAEKLRPMGVELDLRQSVFAWLADTGYTPEYGAREIARLVTRRIEDPIAEMILGARVGHGSRLEVCVRDKDLHIKARAKKPKRRASASASRTKKPRVKRKSA